LDKICKSIIQNKMKYISYIFLIFVLFAGCSSSNKTKNELSRDIDDLKSAPLEITLENQTYYLDAYIWRDFMPSTDSSLNRGLMALINVRTADGAEIPASLTAGKVWILYKNDVWETKPVKSVFRAADILEVYASRGPEWDKGVNTDVVIEIKLNNKTKLLGIKNQEIHAVY
jgi:hypothetical protein